MAGLFPNTITSTIIEYAHNELMAIEGGVKQISRLAHFLKPIASSIINGPPLKLPSPTPETKWQLKVTYNGWFTPLDRWSAWVYAMHSKYSNLWKQAGIYQSVMLSTYRFTRNDELVFGIAERWCSDTNTFVFPWGEATITLEDMMVLGGFSVTGDSVLLPLEESVEQGKIMEVLKKSENIGHKQWLDRFMGALEFEHEAFLCLWLSRYVFPGELRCRISCRVFLLAIRLASGKRLALAPAVLASLYRDLGLLKEAMVVSTELSVHYWLFVSLFSPFYFVEAWVWERFVSLRPGKASVMRLGDARMARWRARRRPNVYEVEKVRSAVNDPADSFLWRPYVEALDNWPFPVFYVERQVWIKCGDGLTVEFEAFARCLRSCHIAGMDCVEPYNPHRVARQFGFDQDLPGWIGREQLSPEAAWCEYSKPFGAEEILYVPSRNAGSDVSSRYCKWWGKMVLCPVVPFPGLLKGRRSSRGRRVQFAGDDSKASMDFALTSPRKGKDKFPEVPPGFEAICSTSHSSTSHNNILLDKFPQVPPGFEGQANNCAETETSSELVLWKSGATDVPVGILSKFKVRKRIGNTFGNPLKATNRIGHRRRKVSHGLEMKSLADVRLTANPEPVTNQLMGSNSGAQPVNGQLIKSITCTQYLQVVSSKRALRIENGPSTNVNAAVLSDVEVEVSRVEGEIAALRSTDPGSSRSSSVPDIETRVSAIKVRVAAIERELAALKQL